MKHQAPISGVAAYEDAYVLTAGYDNQVILWDQRTGAPLARAWHDHLANQVAFSPDGKHAVTASSDYSARIWTVPGLRLVAVLADHDDDVEMACFSPVAPLVATASRDYLVRVFDFTGTVVARLRGHTSDVISVAWSADGSELISSSDDGTIKRWSLRDKVIVGDVDLHGVETDTVTIAADGTVYAGDDNGEVLVVRDGSVEPVQAHDAGIKRLVLDGGRGMLISLSYDRKMALWSVASTVPTLISTSALPTDVWPRSAAFAGESTIVFATFGSTYRTFDYRRGTWSDRPVDPTPGINAVLTDSAGSRWTVGDAGIVRRDGVTVREMGSLCNFLVESGGRLLTGGQLGAAFDVASGRTIHQHRSPLNCAVEIEHQTGPLVVIGTYTGEGLVFRLAPSGDTLVKTLPLCTNAVKGLAVSGDLLMAVSADRAAVWHRCSDLAPVAALPAVHDRIANGCAGLGDGWFASVSRDRKLRIWSPDREMFIYPTPHAHSIKCVAAAPELGVVATADYFGTAALFDAHERRWIESRRLTSSGISSLNYDSGRHRFCASSYDGEVYILNVPVAHLSAGAVREAG